MNSEKKNDSIIEIALLVAIICFLPLIVYAKVVYYEGIIQEFYNKPGTVNFFTWHRAIWLYILTGTGLFFFFKKRSLESSWYHKPMLAIAFFSILSAAFAKYQKIALYGNPERSEGLWTWLSYLVITFLFVQIVQKLKDLRIITGALMFSAAIIGVIGVFQFFGYDYFHSSFCDNYLIPETVFELAPGYDFTVKPVEISSIFSTFGNSNFTGSYMAMLFPLSLILVFWLKNKARSFVFLVHILMFMNLVGSKSRAALGATFITILLSVIFIRKAAKYNFKIVCFLLLSYLITFFAMEAHSIKGPYRLIDTFFRRATVNSVIKSSTFESVEIENHSASVVFGGKTLKVSIGDGGELVFFNSDGEKVPYRFIKVDEAGMPFAQDNDDRKSVSSNPIALNASNNELKVNFEDSELNKAEIERKLVEGLIQLESPEIYRLVFKPSFLPGFETLFFQQSNVIKISRGNPYLFLHAGTQGISVLNHLWKKIDVSEAMAIGFKDREMFGTGRGYIWSRTLPLLKKVLLIGFGPDTFIGHFPNRDYLGKLKYWGSMQVLFEKPHSLYLQIALNSGFIALFAFLSMIFVYLRDSFKIYFFNSIDDFSFFCGIGIALAILGYLIAGIFNDSMISVAPVFWGLLGLGIATNRMNRKLIEKNCCQIVGDA